jgi:hypothetical protein
MAIKKPTQVITETEAQYGYLKGKAKWAKVLEPDDYGKFSVNLYPDQEDLEKYAEMFESISEAAKIEVEDKNKKVSGLADIVKEDDEGNYFFSFKLPAEGYNGTANKIDMYDAGGNKVEEWDKLVGNGSLVKVKFQARPYYMNSTKMVGTSLKFYAMQVINLVQYSAGGDSGFGDETSADSGFDLAEDVPF